MRNRTFAGVASPSLWPWQRGMATRNVLRSAAAGLGDLRQALPDFGGRPRAGWPRPSTLPALLRAAWRRHRTRRCLAELDAHALKDIGVTFAEAEAEANKPFWVA